MFVVYNGNKDDQPGISTYHSAAAAMESRLFPAFTYDPGAAAGLAGRTDLSQNPRPDERWSTGSFAFVDADDREKTIELAFTPADFLLCDLRAGKHFWRVPPAKWHPDLLPFHEYLDLDEEKTETKIPYLTAVGPEGDVMRVVPTRFVVDFVRRCGALWRIVQDYGGIDSSFALAAVSREKQRLEEAKEREIETIRKEYEDQLKRNLGDVTREIIRRIVDGIVADSAPGVVTPGADAPTGSGPEARTSAPSSGPSGSPGGGAAQADEEEEEEVSFDEPYIDTPLCTSCNECTNINQSMFAYNENKQAYIRDASAGTYRELVLAAEKCPVHIIHPGKPKNPDEPGLDELIGRAARFD